MRILIPYELRIDIFFHMQHGDAVVRKICNLHVYAAIMHHRFVHVLCMLAYTLSWHTHTQCIQPNTLDSFGYAQNCAAYAFFVGYK